MREALNNEANKEVDFDKKEADKMLPTVSSMLDKLAKRNIIHKNKASNLKSKLTLQVAGL